jgi:hypothetical protein
VVLVVFGGLTLLPALFPGFSIQRKRPAQSDLDIAYVLITQTPVPTYTPGITPSPAPTELTPHSETAPAQETAQPNAAPTQIAITLVNPLIPATSIVPSAPPTPVAPPPTYRVEGIRFQQQGWNNCGPANLAMGLSFYGWQGTQRDTAAYLKPEREDRNVSPQQMVDYVNTFTDYRAIWRMAGSLDQLRWLMANGFAVIVESGYDPRNGEGWYGHYETLVGYDDKQGTITVYDSYLGRPSTPSLTRSYAIFDRDWQMFNRNFIVIYPAHREVELSNFLGADWFEQDNRRKAAEVAQREALETPNNGFAWFNLGTSLAALGRYQEAVVAFQRATALELPWRMLWYQFGLFESLLQTQRFQDVLNYADDTLATRGGQYIEELYYYKGRVYESQGNYTSAIEQYNEALKLNPNYTQAQIALQRVGG